MKSILNVFKMLVEYRFIVKITELVLKIDD